MFFYFYLSNRRRSYNSLIHEKFLSKNTSSIQTKIRYSEEIESSQADKLKPVLYRLESVAIFRQNSDSIEGDFQKMFNIDL